MITISSENIFKAIFGIEKANLENPKDEPVVVIYDTTDSSSQAGLYLLNRYYRFQEKNPHIGFKTTDIEAIKEKSSVAGKIKCYYCQGKTEKQKITIDHVFPICFGGKNYFSNIRLSCVSCNSMKGGIDYQKMPVAWAIFKRNVKKGVKDSSLNVLLKALVSSQVSFREKTKLMILISKEEELEGHKNYKAHEVSHAA